MNQVSKMYRDFLLSIAQQGNMGAALEYVRVEMAERERVAKINPTWPTRRADPTWPGRWSA